MVKKLKIRTKTHGGLLFHYTSFWLYLKLDNRAASKRIVLFLTRQWTSLRAVIAVRVEPDRLSIAEEKRWVGLPVLQADTQVVEGVPQLGPTSRSQR
jgi:hypothetical protein